MKTLLFVLLAFAPSAASATGPPKIFFAQTFREIVLRQEIDDALRVNNLRDEVLTMRRDIRILRYGSYDWFWKPKLIISKTNYYRAELASGNYGTVAFKLTF